MNNPLNNPEIQKGLFYLVVGVGVAWFIKSKISANAEAVTEVITKKLNPASTENVVYNLPAILTGTDYSFGSRLYDWFGGEEDYSGTAEAGFEKPWYEGWFDFQETPEPVKQSAAVEDQNFVYKTANNLLGVDSIGSSIYGVQESISNWYNNL